MRNCYKNLIRTGFSISQCVCYNLIMTVRCDTLSRALNESLILVSILKLRFTSSIDSNNKIEIGR